MSSARCAMLPEGMDKQLLEETKAAFASAQSTWSEAGTAFAAGDLDGAVEKARASRGHGPGSRGPARDADRVNREARREALDPLDLYDIAGSLSEEERMVQDAVARLVDEKVLPVIQKHFEDHTFPRDLVPEIAALGLLGSSIAGYDCAGMNSVSYGLICQELERGDSGIRSFVSVQSSLCMYPIHAFGSEAQREKYLPRMATGELIGCFGLTEPHGGSDPVNMKTHAKRRGKDWVLNGAKMWITNAPIADLAIVWAKTEEGIRGFIVEKGTRGFAAPEIERKFSLRASATGALYFEDVVVPEENMLPGQHDRPQGAALLPRRRRATASPGASSARRRPASRSSSTTRRRACCSAGRSPRTRRSRSASPRWRAASRARSSCRCSSAA